MPIKRFEADQNTEMSSVADQDNANASDTDWVIQNALVRIDVQDFTTPQHANRVAVTIDKLRGRILEYLESSGNMPDNKD